ncbi:MAG: zinc ribbon domain-containing protein [Lachnospiraceae bacterium]|nr:zinc ribbon domain-containing protein [Lachnospiraceae bacterium]
MKICQNCGAEIEDTNEVCPYCGYITRESAINKLKDEIEDIKYDIADVKKEPAKAFKKGLGKGTKVILLTVLITVIFAAIIAVILIKELGDEPRIHLSAEEEAYATAYKVAAGEELAKAYEEKNIGKMAEIFDKAYSIDRVSLWGDKHYETGHASSCYMKLQQCLPNLNKDKISKKEAEEITYYCFYFYYRAYGEDGAVIFDDIRDNEILPIITDRLMFTEEDMESFREKVTDPPYVNRSRVYGIVKDNYKNYR